MNFDELQYIILNDNILKNHFLGIKEAQYFKGIKENGFTIIYVPNVEIGHFVCYTNFDKLYFFDSFGHSPIFFNLPNKIEYNPIQIQDKSSCLCGAYIIFILHHSIQNNIQIEKFISQTFTSNNLKHNDSIVYNWIKTAGIHKNILKCN